MDVQQLKALTNQVHGRRTAAMNTLSSIKAEIKVLEKKEQLLTYVSEVFRSLIDREVNEGVKAVESLQTEGLRVVFDDQDLEVKANVEIQRGKVSVDLVTHQNKANGRTIEGSSVDSFGGSVLTVQSILMRIIVIIRRNLRPVLFLDESLPAFDPNYVHNMGKFLSDLCKRLNMDILVVTHDPVLFDTADHAYHIVSDGTSSEFVKVR